MPHCRDFRTTIDILTKQAFRVFLNIPAEVEKWDETTKTCFLVIRENPFAEFVILPQSCQNTLWYSNLLCGMIKGALQTIGVVVKAYFVKDVLRGDTETVIRVEFVKVLKEDEQKEADSD
jgi:hypothetical protein